MYRIQSVGHVLHAVANLGFLREGRQPIIWQFFAIDYMKMKEIGPSNGGGTSKAPTGSTTTLVQ